MTRHFAAAAAASALALLLVPAGVGAQSTARAPVKLAVFDFELEDATPAAVYLNQNTSSASIMEKVSGAARRELSQSGHYTVIDAGKGETKPGQALSDCDGCEAGLALRLGADEALIGVVRRVTQTDYYVVIRIRDAHTGKVLDQQEANFAGSEEGWPSGVRMLIKHQLLATAD